MGPKSSKHKGSKDRILFPIETPHTYFEQNNLLLESFSSIRTFKKPKFAPKILLPKELWSYIFGQVNSISFLGLVSQVCQDWYFASLSDNLWKPFCLGLLEDQQSESLISYRSKVFHSRIAQKLIILPDSFQGNKYPSPGDYGYIKVVVMGSNGVGVFAHDLLIFLIQFSNSIGKSCISVQFENGIFIDGIIRFLVPFTLSILLIYFIGNYDPTIESSRRISRYFHKEKFSMLYEVLDTAGTEQFTAMRDLYIRNGQVFIIVYSVVDRSSFYNIQSIYDDITRISESESKPIILVANKTDLTQQRAVSTQEGYSIAQQLNIGFIELTAKSKTKIEELFHLVAELSLIHRHVSQHESKT